MVTANCGTDGECKACAEKRLADNDASSGETPPEVRTPTIVGQSKPPKVPKTPKAPKPLKAAAYGSADAITRVQQAPGVMAGATANDANFASEDQRRYMWSQEPDIAESWAHGEHTSDKNHKMPEGPGPGVKGPMAEAARKAKRATTNANPEGHNQYSSGAVDASKGAREASREAGKASLSHAASSASSLAHGRTMTGSPDAMNSHLRAAGAHNRHADLVERGGHTKEASLHRAAASAHEKAALAHDKPIGNSEMTSNHRKSLWQKLGEALGITTNAPQPRHPNLGKYQGKADKSANTGYDSHRGDVKPVGDQRAKDGRDMSPIEHEDQDDDDPNDIDNLADQQADDHQNPSSSPAHLKTAADKVGIKEKTENAMPFPPQMQAQPQGMQQAQQVDPAHSASKDAAGASLATEHAPAFGHAQTAMASSADGDSSSAAKSHGFAAKQHEKASVGAMKDGDEAGADQHLQAAALHRKAAAMHSATRNQRGDNVAKVTTNMPAGGAFKGAQDAGFSASQAAAMAGKLEGSYEGTGGPSKGAHEASQHATLTKSAGAHRAAAASHKEAAEHHEEKGNDEAAQAHRTSAAYHTRAAKKATRNEATVNSLVENGHLHPASVGEALATLNAEDESGDGSSTVQAGGEEEDEDAKDMDEEDVSTVGAKKLTGKKTMNAAQWLAEAPPEVQSVVRNAMNSERRDKVKLIRRLTANCGSDQVRNRLVKVLQERSLDELRIMASAMAPTQNNGFEQQETSPLFLGAGGSGLDYQQPTANAADNDILPLPETLPRKAAQ